MKSRIFALVLCFTLFPSIMPTSAREMYAPDGRSITIHAEETEAYRNVGWYDMPVKTMYAPDGRSIIVYVEEADDYRNVGWYDMPVKTMYAPDGRSIIVYTEETEAYRNVGWYDVPVAVLYTLDGREAIVSEAEIGLYENLGWYREPVAIMTKNGVSQVVLLSETEAYRINGWTISKYYSSLYNLGLQIENYMKGKYGRYGVYIKNLNTGETLILNDGQYSAASIIKLFVMAGVYNEINNGSLILSNSIRSYLSSMITLSDNYSSNQLVKAIGNGNYLRGFNNENAFSHSVGCIYTQHKSLFSECGDYVSYGRNFVSPKDCGILLEKIYNKTLVSEECSNEMLNLLKAQTRRNKIPYSLPYGTICANKTGETETVQSDVGIVYSPNCDYIICVITNNSPTGINDIRQISKMTYYYFN